jgi:hypothetical protein
VHEELKRSKRCIYRALEDHFKYGDVAMGRHIDDIVYFEVLNQKEEQEDHVLKVSRYIEAIAK